MRRLSETTSANYSHNVNLPYLHRSTPTLPPLSDAERELAAALKRDVETLALDIGPRGTFAPGRYRLAEDFLTSALTRAGYEVKRHAFEAFDVECANLEAILPGRESPERVLILGAHYDSIEGCPAANDNASGVAGVLAAARAMAADKPACTVRFVLFANEEPPHFNMDTMGSQIYARRCQLDRHHLRMVCLETIGCYSKMKGSQRWPIQALDMLLPDIGDFIALVGITESQRFIKAASQAFEKQQAFPMLAAAAPASTNYLSASDHRGFNESGYEAFMITDTAPFRYPHYHEPTDTPDKLDFESMARVVRGVIGMVRELASH